MRLCEPRDDRAFWISVNVIISLILTLFSLAARADDRVGLHNHLKINNIGLLMEATLAEIWALYEGPWTLFRICSHRHY